MDWESVMASHLDAEQRVRLSSACVGLAGAGGLGSNCATLLARCGVGRLVLVDFDVVSLSNLNRQNFLPEHVGRLKVEALASMLRIPVCMHNVSEQDIFRPSAWAGFGMEPEGSDYRACETYGAIYK